MNMKNNHKRLFQYKPIQTNDKNETKMQGANTKCCANSTTNKLITLKNEFKCLAN